MFYPAACHDFFTEALEGLTKYTASFTWSQTGFKIDSFLFSCLLSMISSFPLFGIHFYQWQWDS